MKAIQEELVLEQNRDDPDDDVIEDKEAELELAKLNLGTMKCEALPRCVMLPSHPLLLLSTR